MSQADAEARLKLAMEHALMAADGETSVLTLACRIYEAEREIMAMLRRPWMVERIVRMLKARINQQGSEKQGKLPGLEGLPVKIPAKDEGEKVKVQLRNATLPQLLSSSTNLTSQW